MFNIFNRSPQEILLTIPGILIALAFHEFGHAFVSDRLGDPTPRSQGRLTLSPLPHIDILGFILIVLVGFGWAKPVQINPRYYKKPRRDEILVSVAGPAMNLIMALIFLGFTKLLYIYVPDLNLGNNNMMNIIRDLFLYTIQINIVLCIFNLIPIYPLDGSHIIFNIFNYRNYNVINFLNRYGTIILIVVIISPLSYYIISLPTKIVLNWMFSLVSIPINFV